MIEKWYQPLLPVGGVHANTLCSNECIFQCIYLLMVELPPACHSVCHREIKIQCERHCRQFHFTVSKQVHTNMTVISMTQYRPLFLSFPLFVLSHSWRTSSLCLPVYFLFLSPPPLLSPDIKPWLLCKCIQLSNIIHCSELRDSTCFSSLHHFVAVGPFPPYVLLVWMGILQLFWYSSPKSLTDLCASIISSGETFWGLIL